MNKLIEQNFKPKSSLIKEVAFSYADGEHGRVSEKIVITFQDGAIHEYGKPLSFTTDVSMEMIYLGLKEAESVGKYWHKHIKGKLDYKKIR